MNDIDNTNDIENNGAIAAEPWRIREAAFDPARAFLHETLFTLGNGYIGMRGTPDEGTREGGGQTLEGTYLNGFYDTEAIRYPENAYGLARVNEFMLNVPNAKRVAAVVDGERFSLDGGRVLAWERTLDLKTGLLVRTVEWETATGKRLRIASRRLVCCTRKHVAAIEYAVTPLNFSGPVRVDADIDAAVTNLQAGDDPRVARLMRADERDADRGILGQWLQQGHGARDVQAGHQPQRHASGCGRGEQRLQRHGVVHEPTGAGVERIGRCGRGHALAVPHEKHRFQLAFESRQSRRDGRLRDEAPSRAGGDAAGLVDR